jgi:hypothetical protein
VSNIHAFILGVVASWTPSAVLFALLVRPRSAATPISETPDGVGELERRDRDRGKRLLRDEQGVCVPFRPATTPLAVCRTEDQNEAGQAAKHL